MKLKTVVISLIAVGWASASNASSFGLDPSAKYGAFTYGEVNGKLVSDATEGTRSVAAARSDGTNIRNGAVEAGTSMAYADFKTGKVGAYVQSTQYYETGIGQGYAGANLRNTYVISPLYSVPEDFGEFIQVPYRLEFDGFLACCNIASYGGAQVGYSFSLETSNQRSSFVFDQSLRQVSAQGYTGSASGSGSDDTTFIEFGNSYLVYGVLNVDSRELLRSGSMEITLNTNLFATAYSSGITNFYNTATFNLEFPEVFAVRDLAQEAQAAAGAVPEPASWVMMIGGFGMVGGAMRSRRRQSNVSVATA